MRGLPLQKAAVCCEQKSHEHQQQDGNEDSFHTVPLPLVCATSNRRRGARRGVQAYAIFSLLSISFLPLLKDALNLQVPFQGSDL